MAVDLETYVPLHESSVTHQAHEMVHDKGSPHWYTKVRTLSNKHASTLVLLFFVDSEAYDTVLKLSGMPRTMYLPHLIAQSTFDLFVTRKFSMHELVMVAKAIVRLNHAVEWAVLRGLETRRLASSWLPNPIAMPPGDTSAVHRELRQTARIARDNPQDFLFFYEWPALSVDKVVAPDLQKLSFTFRMCATLRDEPVSRLRHYMVDCNDDRYLMLTKLSRNSATETIGALLDNSPDWIERFFALTHDQMLCLLRTLHSLEYSLILLSEVKRRGLAS